MTTASPQTARGANRWLSIASLWIGLILLLIEGLIGTRLVLKMAGASEGNGFVDLIYNLSDPLVRPFEGIFDARTVGDDGVFEPEALIALIVYPIVAMLLGVLLRTVAASAPQPKADIWGTSARDLYVRISTLQNSLAASAAIPASAAAGPPRIVDSVDPQIDELTTSLHSLELNPPNDRAGMAVRNVLVALNGVRGALRAESAAVQAAARPAAHLLPRLPGWPCASSSRPSMRRFRSSGRRSEPRTAISGASAILSQPPAITGDCAADSTTLPRARCAGRPRDAPRGVRSHLRRRRQ